MLTKNDLQRLSEIRLEDALHLLQANKASSAYYLAGYSVELGLKACISNLFQENVIPDKGLVNAIYTHSLEALMNTSGLLPELNADIKADAMFGANWGRSTPWVGDPRVNIQNDKGKAKPYQVRQVLQAIGRLEVQSG